MPTNQLSMGSLHATTRLSTGEEYESPSAEVHSLAHPISCVLLSDIVECAAFLSDQLHLLICCLSSSLLQRVYRFVFLLYLPHGRYQYSANTLRVGVVLCV